jgi:hypothetical protein
VVVELGIVSSIIVIPSKPAMGNLRPFNLFCVALLKPLKYAYFIEKSTKSVESVSILALDMTYQFDHDFCFVSVDDEVFFSTISFTSLKFIF